MMVDRKCDECQLTSITALRFDLQEGGVLVEVYNNQSMFRYDGWSIQVYAF